MVGVRQQCHLGQRMQLICQLGGSVRACLQVCQQSAQAGTLARPYTHAGTPAHASHAEDIGTVLFQGVGFMICVYLSFRSIALRSGNRNRSINRRGGARARWGWVGNAIWCRACILSECQGGERAGVPPSLPARCTSRHTGASAHARRHVCTRLARRIHLRRPVQGLGFVICVYFILSRHSARQRHHDAFGAGIPPSLIQ